MEMISFTPTVTLPGGKEPLSIGDMRPKVCLGATGKIKGLGPYWESSYDFQSHYTDQAITEHLQSKHI